MMEQKEYKKPETEQEYLQILIDHGSTDGWSLIGKLEWPKMPYKDGSGEYEYNEMPTDIMGNADYLWMKMELRDTWSQQENPEDRRIIGKHREYYWCTGIPPNGNVMYRYTPWTVMEILQYLANRGYVVFGRPNAEGKSPCMRVPDKVRLHGMKEWVCATDNNHTVAAVEE